VYQPKLQQPQTPTVANDICLWWTRTLECNFGLEADTSDTINRFRLTISTRILLRDFSVSERWWLKIHSLLRPLRAAVMMLVLSDGSDTVCIRFICCSVRWGKFSQKHNYEYSVKWWCLLVIENYMFRPIAAIIRFCKFLAIRIIYNMHKPLVDTRFMHIIRWYLG